MSLLHYVKDRVANILPPLENSDDPRSLFSGAERLPMKTSELFEHVRVEMGEFEIERVKALFSKIAEGKKKQFGLAVEIEATAIVSRDDQIVLGTTKGLYFWNRDTQRFVRHEHYGVGGPLSTHVTALAVDLLGSLWIGTPLGLTHHPRDGSWLHFRGAEGLPVEHVTSLAVDHDNLWIGSARGAIYFKPQEKITRRWYYRAGPRYLGDDRVNAIAPSLDRDCFYFETESGFSKIQYLRQTLQEKASAIEFRLNRFHRREGLICSSVFDRAQPECAPHLMDSNNDGLWTGLHVMAMALAYATTKEPAYLTSAKIGMHAMIKLQTISGRPGLVARSFISKEIYEDRKKKGQLDKSFQDGRVQWKLAPDEKVYWKTDVSSDEIVGHFFAIYGYWQFIAQHTPEERTLIIEQVRVLMDFILENNAQIIDWDGKRTTWGFWNPEEINDNPERHLNTGLASLQILSFLSVAYHITGDSKYWAYSEKLIHEQGYLNNVLLEKKVFPDPENYSDSHLAYLAWYPLLQLEKNKERREIFQRAVRRHYQIIEPTRASLFYFVSATIDLDYVDLESAVQTLMEIPTDRRDYCTRNGDRKDVTISARVNRFGRSVLTRVLPCDERSFRRWNADPYVGDVLGFPEGDPRILEDDGGSWLLAYWMGRYHGFISG